MADVNNTAVAEPETEVESEGTRARLDPELKQLGQICRILDGADEHATARMVAYIYQRYSPKY